MHDVRFRRLLPDGRAAALPQMNWQYVMTATEAAAVDSSVDRTSPRVDRTSPRPPIVPDRKLNVVYASRTCFGKALQALQASQGAGLETWSMYARLAPRSQCKVSSRVQVQVSQAVATPGLGKPVPR